MQSERCVLISTLYLSNTTSLLFNVNIDYVRGRSKVWIRWIHEFHDWISEMAGVKILYGGSVLYNKTIVTKWFFLLKPRNMQTNK